jgi:hypothetical protein
MLLYKIFILSIFFVSTSLPQQITIRGRVIDFESNSPLSFANIRVQGTTLGTSTNADGVFELKVDSPEVMLIASYIGYYSDTITINNNNYKNYITIFLKSTDIILPEVLVKPGENPANNIILQAIEKKKIRNNLLNNYQVEAYTKGVIRTTEDITSKGSGINLGLGGSDTTELFISGILENHSQGYFQKPDKYKEVILARKQSANFPPSINILTGGRLIQNFYENEVNFLGRDLPGPISDNALNYYYYYIENIVAQNDKKIFQIHIEPNTSSDPGFEGKIFISDSSFDLVKVDLMLNRAANTGNLFDTINIYQQFDNYNEIMMPVDYRLFVKANVLGLVRFGFELNTILFNYKINNSIPENIFDKAIVTVLPDADKVDTFYWQKTQTIPNTEEEQIAYTRIDSVESIPKKFLDDFSPLDSKLSITDNFSVSAPIAMYHFSRVEGHAIDFGLYLDDAFERRFNSSLKLSYGFSDEKFKQDFSAGYLLGNYRTWEVKFKAFNKLKILFEESDNYGELFSTLVTLFAKNEFRDYYYSNGFQFELEGEILPIAKIVLGFKNKTDNSAFVNTNFSITNKEKEYRSNPAIYETKINSFKIGFDFDFRDYIEDGYFRRRTSLGRSYVLLSTSVTYSNPDFLTSDLKFTTYELSAKAFIRTFNSAYMNINFYGRSTDGATPYQDLYSLPGNIDVIFSPQTFRTLNVNEIVGDKILIVNLTHDFRDEIFRWLNIPKIKNWEIMLSLIFNTAIADITPESYSILTNPVKTLKHPFYELGFGVGQGLLPFKLEFMWKLNYRDGNNFRIGLNMPLF